MFCCVVSFSFDTFPLRGQSVVGTAAGLTAVGGNTDERKAAAIPRRLSSRPLWLCKFIAKHKIVPVLKFVRA